jgi:hypothetical protein
MMTNHCISVAPAVLLGVAIGIAGCGARPATFPQPLTDGERATIADTVRQLSREASQTFDSDLDCAEIMERLAGGGFPSYSVAQGRVIEAGSREDMVVLCRRIKRDRLSAHEDIHEVRVEVLNRDAAYVVTRGDYTVRFRDGRTMVRPQVVTTVWARRPEGWQMAHLHESWQEATR